MAITFPDLDPVALQIGPLAIRWYALAYIAGLFGGLKYTEYLVKKYCPLKDIITLKHIEDLFTYVALGVIFGGRLGYVLFYKPTYYFNHPEKILHLWEGGMSFHGGALGVILGVMLFSHLRKIPLLALGDIVVPAVPIGLFFGRIANFINGELYGRATDVSWGVRFPDPYLIGQYLEPRHPSQLYEAFTEGLILFLVLHFLATKKDSCLKNYGFLSGMFLFGYGLARIFCEFFRAPDSFLGFIFTIFGLQITQGMILCLPMILVGGGLMAYSLRQREHSHV